MKKLFVLIATPLLLFSCKKEVTAPETPTVDVPETETIPKNYFINAKIDGIAWEARDSSNACLINVGHDAVVNTIQDSLHLAYTFRFDQGTAPTTPLNGKLDINYLNFNHKYSEYLDSISYFSRSFSIGATSFRKLSNLSAGIELSYTDNNNVKWSTINGDQTGSYFKIENIVSTVVNGKSRRSLKGSFKGKVYQQGNPVQHKNITEGTFYIVFERY